MYSTRRTAQHGFTLIELSIVLVIIGLIVGGVLTGQDLIRAAGVRAQISQIEKYNTAVNTFRGKYGYLPGDMNAVTATQFGFVARGSQLGQGDGNGIIEGNAWFTGGSNGGTLECGGETTVFWVDLSQANLIDGGFNSASETLCQNTSLTSTPSVSQFFPGARIGRGNYIYVWSGGPLTGNGTNYFGLSVVQGMGGGGSMASLVGLTVYEAYSIDKKMDDGLPQSGNVTATYVEGNDLNSVDWAAGGGIQGASNAYNPTNVATPYASTNCYDNNNIAGPQTYSLTQNSTQVNCALSFRFQ
jgi:prepilin-type N-terminal cleavage/methylation domain-containing protein